jgi:[glutamine synthetase] adenylyltransferase / [glutamine synthetase]-adenylyl-L-tyrosine phosphorylase
MKELHSGFSAARWPRPADPAQAAIELERWTEAAAELERGDRGFAEAVARDPVGKTLLEAIFGNSPYLTHGLIEEGGFALDLLHRGPDSVFADLLGAASREFGQPTDELALMAGLRRLKRQASVVIALADIADLWSVEAITAALSDVADMALKLAVCHLLRQGAASGAFKLKHPKDPERDSGFVVLGMGKLGARELNYSSDIDLIVLFDPETIVSDNPDGLLKIFIRLTRTLVKILDERRPEGYVFRTDLRLRPDPASTPLALSMLAAETYYESLGQNWERAAMIKARPVAGDIAAGEAFLKRLRPFVWRKSLDFSAIQDIHSIKRQINAHRGGATVALAGHNIKLGRGGIREIEFFAQTQQLIWGGRSPELRQIQTCSAIEALRDAGRVKPDVATTMIDAYRFLRRIEHRLQMIDDQQTHTLPDGDRLQAFTTFLGYDSVDAFGREMLEQLSRVERHYAELFEDEPDLGGPGNLVFTGTEDDPATLETLSTLGFRDAKMVATTVRGWHHGRYRAMRSVRARELLTELMPVLLEALARTAQPDTAFVRFDGFLSQLPAGVQLFSLFHANPALLQLVAEIMGGAPRLADLLSRQSHLLDSVLATQFLVAPPDAVRMAAELDSALRLANDFQDTLDVLRRWKNEREFQVGVQMLSGVISPTYAGAVLANIAEVSLAALQPAAEEEFARTHGRVPGGAMSIAAFGKLGGREMTVTSDLDLIFLWDAPAEIEQSEGPKPLPVSLYYQRLTQRLINAINAPTGEGKLYEVDLRLRPSGSKGPIATNLDGFVKYQHNEAWTWEHQALTRARPITGPAALQTRIRAAIRDVLVKPRDTAKLTRDVADMRTLMAQEHAAKQPWDIKHWRGGLIDIEFLAQYFQLRYAAARPDILTTNTAEAITGIMAAGLLSDEDGKALLDALKLWQTVQGLLRLTLEGDGDVAAAPEGLKTALASAAGAVDFADLEAKIRARSASALAIFERVIRVEG